MIILGLIEKQEKEVNDDNEEMEEILIFTIKTSIGYEKSAADALASRAKKSKRKLYSILVPSKLRGYLLVEATNFDSLRELIRGLPHIRGVIQGTTPFEEIEHFLTPEPLVTGISEGDIIELISGPFKGEKARVQHIDESKEEITVELFESIVPIPVTIRGDHARVLEKGLK